MKKAILLLVIISLSVLAASAEEIFNYALNTKPVGIFSNPAAAVDGLLSTRATSGNISEGPQFLTIDLGKELYVGSVKIYWDARALSRDYSIRVSKDSKNWFSEFSGLDASSGAADPASGTISQVVSTRRYTTPSRYVQIYIPIGSSASAAQVNISEIQILPAQNLKFVLESVDSYAVSSQRAVIVYKTSIGAVSGQAAYGKDPSRFDKFAVNSESGVLNSVVLSGLEPGAVYYYKIKARDASGNTVQSDVKNLKPPLINLALNKNVSGTFTELPPNDLLVNRSNPVLPRVVDGKTGYFDSMATSGSIRKSDQEVTIDLGGSYSIGAVISYWRALAYPEDFSVSISNDRTSWKEVASKVNAGEGAFVRSDAGDPMRVINTSVDGGKARYVRILIAKDSPYFVKHSNWDFVQLMEVEVVPK